MKIQLGHRFEDIANVENLLEAWREFSKGKRSRRDVQEFSLSLMDNVLLLHQELSHHTYKHGGYQAFNVCDPKPRRIHKASVRDRLLHHALYRVLYPFFDRAFIADSFSCRLRKGTHKALNRFRHFGNVVSRNNTRTCWVLKCDIQKFFASINHNVLLSDLAEHIPDANVMCLLREVIGSFSSTRLGVGLPLGNLTSQLLANIYMNEFDQFVKHTLRASHYVRYSDDFAILSADRERLEKQISPLREYLQERLRLTLHPRKVSISTLGSGVDFLGWVHFPNHRILRTSTRRRMLVRVRTTPNPATLDSYLGLLSYGNTHKLQEEIAKQYLLSIENPKPIAKRDNLDKSFVLCYFRDIS